MSTLLEAVDVEASREELGDKASEVLLLFLGLPFTSCTAGRMSTLVEAVDVEASGEETGDKAVVLLRLLCSFECIL
jgi:hypothetical protein